MKLFIIKHTTSWMIHIIGIYAKDANDAYKLADIPHHEFLHHHELLHVVDVTGIAVSGIAFTSTVELENYEG